MCGIAGVVVWDGSPGLDPEPVVLSMTQALVHRGPDAQGVVRCCGLSGARGPQAVFGHRRLSIIDLSDRAAQPMRAEDEPVWLTYNGEVYNYLALRRELEDLGHPFASESDTEVILRGYLQWGEGVVDRLRGMYAFALWDGREGRLVTARDRFGIKPLYVHRTESLLLFASEVRALLASGLVPRRLDRVALGDFLECQTAPSPRTLVEGVCMQLPATVVVHTPQGARERCYWDLLQSPGSRASDADGYIEDTRRLLDEATQLHLVSDVPVGVFLSGGIDSGAVAALVRSAGVMPRTFCVSFPGTSYDEGPAARRVADALGAEHTEIVLSTGELRDRIPEAVTRVDHPSGDGLNTFIVSQAVRAAGVKVALSGLGGDELFGGYPSFRRLRRLARYAPLWRLSPRPVRYAAARAVRALGNSTIAAEKAATLLESDGSLPRAYALTREVFPLRWRRALLGAAAGGPGAEGAYTAMLEAAYAAAPTAGVTARVSYAEARTYMHDVLLRDTDQMSMAHGLEVRVPLLDHRLAEHIMALPEESRRQGRQSKRLLVEALGPSLPGTVLNQPKRGFVLPLDAWMRRELRELCEHCLAPARLSARAGLDATAVQELWQLFLAGHPEVTWSRPWTLVALGAWLEQTGVTA